MSTEKKKKRKREEKARVPAILPSRACHQWPNFLPVGFIS
jgi:hypothetical protein